MATTLRPQPTIRGTTVPLPPTGEVRAALAEIAAVLAADWDRRDGVALARLSRARRLLEQASRAMEGE